MFLRLLKVNSNAWRDGGCRISDHVTKRFGNFGVQSLEVRFFSTKATRLPTNAAQKNKELQMKQKTKFRDEKKELLEVEDQENDKYQLLKVEEEMRSSPINQLMQSNQNFFFRLFCLCGSEKPTVRLKAAKLLGTIPASKWLEVVSQIQSKAISQENKSKHDLNSNITIGQITRGLESVHTFFMTRKHLISMSIMLHSAFLPDLVDICGEFSPEVAQVLKRISIAYALIDTGISDSMKYLEGALAIQNKLKDDEEICKLVLLKAQILNDLKQKEDAIKAFEETILFQLPPKSFRSLF